MVVVSRIRYIYTPLYCLKRLTDSMTVWFKNGDEDEGERRVGGYDYGGEKRERGQR